MLPDLLQIAATDKKIFNSNKLFQVLHSWELERRQVASVTNKAAPFIEDPRIHYKINLEELNNENVASIITNWLTSGKIETQNERKIRKLQKRVGEYQLRNSVYLTQL